MADYDIEIEFNPPRCRKCGNDATYRVERASLPDFIVAPIGLRPYRCRYCNNRFRPWRWGRVLTRLGSLALAVGLVAGYLALDSEPQKSPNPAATGVREHQGDTSAPAESAAATVQSPAPAVAETGQQPEGSATASEPERAAEAVAGEPDPAAEAQTAGNPVSPPAVEATGQADDRRAEAGPEPAPAGARQLGVVRFAPGRFAPGPSQVQTLKQAVTEALAEPDLKVVVTGYADASPLSAKTRRRFKDNKGVSLARAKAVAGELIALGLPPDRLEIIGVGVDREAMSADEARRVVISLDLERAGAPANVDSAAGAD